MRVTAHNGRVGKNGAYCAKHNDRSFDLSKAEHIDPAREKKNFYWTCRGNVPFTQAEIEEYEHLFRNGLDAKNARYMSQRHSERVQTMADYITSSRTCPEEQIIAIGAKDDHADEGVLLAIVNAQLKWEQDTYPQAKILDWALHTDEKGTPHVHVRKTWIGHDRYGHAVASQNKALAEMGVTIPDPDKQVNRFNNAKMTYTKACREHLIDLCNEYGLEIESEPREASKSGLSLNDYKAKQAQERAERAKKAFEQADAQRQAQECVTRDMERLARSAEREADEAHTEAHKAREQAQALTEELAETREKLADTKDWLKVHTLAKSAIEAIEPVKRRWHKEAIEYDPADIYELKCTAAAADKYIGAYYDLKRDIDQVKVDAQEQAQKLIKEAYDRSQDIAQDRIKSYELDMIRQDHPELFEADGSYQQHHDQECDFDLDHFDYFFEH